MKLQRRDDHRQARRGSRSTASVSLLTLPLFAWRSSASFADRRCFHHEIHLLAKASSKGLKGKMKSILTIKSPSTEHCRLRGALLQMGVSNTRDECGACALTAARSLENSRDFWLWARRELPAQRCKRSAARFLRRRLQFELWSQWPHIRGSLLPFFHRKGLAAAYLSTV